eukprot:scaffold7620_cov277-Pinguiococcus_pyrenoidosus.AAC.3
MEISANGVARRVGVAEVGKAEIPSAEQQKRLLCTLIRMQTPRRADFGAKTCAFSPLIFAASADASSVRFVERQAARRRAISARGNSAGA